MDTFPDSNYEADLYSVETGNVTWKPTVNKRRVESAQMVWIRELEDIFDQPNVKLVNSIFTEEEWVSIFPAAPDSYQDFLTAIAQYPAFCNEFDPIMENLFTLDLACRRELATLFAHIIYESGA